MTTQEVENTLDTETYNQFIDGLQLLDVAVVSANLRSRTSFPDPNATRVEYGFEINNYRRFEEDPSVFTVFTEAKVAFYDTTETPSARGSAEAETGGEQENELLGQVGVSHAIHYSSDVLVNDAIFEAFSDGNIQFQVWPFVREFIHSSTMRFGWDAFTMPTLVGQNLTPSGDDGSTP